MCTCQCDILWFNNVYLRVIFYDLMMCTWCCNILWFDNGGVISYKSNYLAVWYHPHLIILDRHEKHTSTNWRAKEYIWLPDHLAFPSSSPWTMMILIIVVIVTMIIMIILITTMMRTITNIIVTIFIVIMSKIINIWTWCTVELLSDNPFSTRCCCSKLVNDKNHLITLENITYFELNSINKIKSLCEAISKSSQEIGPQSYVVSADGWNIWIVNFEFRLRSLLMFVELRKWQISAGIHHSAVNYNQITLSSMLLMMTMMTMLTKMVMMMIIISAFIKIIIFVDH